jgi:glycosyltransferase involved in cell wall biosynthesis
MSLSLILFSVFIAVVSIQMVYYLSFLWSFAVKRAETTPKKNIPLSVIICAKNEAENLKKNLPIILNQDYSNFEVVLVNDSSSDGTLKIMKDFEANNTKVRLVDVATNERFWGNKKYALTLGIKASRHEFLVFTDADCAPSSDQWLSHISSNFSNQNSIVLGYSGYANRKFSFLNKLIRFETVMTALQYFSYTNLGMPYMGVGRNMAYKKDVFFNNSGFNSHMSLKSGDDDLFINEVANSTNTSICFTEESFTISEPKTSYKAWILQKRRHISTAKFYKLKHKIFLGLFYLSQLLFWVFGVLLLLLGFHWQWVLALITLRFAIQLICFTYTARKFNEIDLIVLTPVLELFLVITQLSIFIANLISKPRHWK